MTDTSISLVRGEHAVYTFTVTSSGSPVDLTGAIIDFAVRGVLPGGTIPDDTDAVIHKTTGSGITLTDPTNGKFEVEFLHADTNALSIASYFYGLEYIPWGSSQPQPIILSSGTAFDNFIIGQDLVRQI